MSDINRIGGGFTPVVAGAAGIAGNHAVRPTGKLDEVVLKLALAVQWVGAGGVTKGRAQVNEWLSVIGHSHLPGRTWIGGNGGNAGGTGGRAWNA